MKNRINESKDVVVPFVLGGILKFFDVYVSILSSRTGSVAIRFQIWEEMGPLQFKLVYEQREIMPRAGGVAEVSNSCRPSPYFYRVIVVIFILIY